MRGTVFGAVSHVCCESGMGRPRKEGPGDRSSLEKEWRDSGKEWRDLGRDWKEPFVRGARMERAAGHAATGVITCRHRHHTRPPQALHRHLALPRYATPHAPAPSWACASPRVSRDHIAKILTDREQLHFDLSNNKKKKGNRSSQVLQWLGYALVFIFNILKGSHNGADTLFYYGYGLPLSYHLPHHRKSHSNQVVFRKVCRLSSSVSS